MLTSLEPNFFTFEWQKTFMRFSKKTDKLYLKKKSDKFGTKYLKIHVQGNFENGVPTPPT